MRQQAYRFFTILSLAAVAPALGQSTQPTTAPSSPASPTTQPSTRASAEIAPLLAALGDAEWQSRAKAQDALVALGTDALPELKAALARSTDPEVKSSLASVLTRIQENKRSGPTLITLHYDDTPALEILQALRAQSGAKIGLWPEDGSRVLPKVTLHADHQPFWSVMKEFMPKAGLQIQQGTRSLQLMQGQNDQMSGPCVQSGPFMVCATNASRSRSISYTNQKNSSTSLGIQMMVYVEPKIRMLSRGYQPVLEEAVDDAGHSLLPPSAQPYMGRGSSTECVFSVQAPLVEVPGMTQRLARLKGYIAISTMLRSETIQMKDLTGKPPSKTVGSRTYAISDVKVEANRVTVKITITGAATAGDRLWQQGFSFSDIELFDANDKSLGNAGGGGGGGGQKLEYNLQFAKNPTAPMPLRLVWEIPTESNEMKIPFEFTDLKLP